MRSCWTPGLLAVLLGGVGTRLKDNLVDVAIPQEQLVELIGQAEVIQGLLKPFNSVLLG